MNKSVFLILVFFTTTICKGQSPVQLAPPLLKYHSKFFKNKVTVEIKFAQPGTQIHYTLNHQQSTEQDKIYTKPIQIKKSFTTIKAMVTGEGFLSSETVSATFIKDGLKTKSVQQTPSSEKFPGNGPNTLIDNEGGITDMSSKTWMGYQQDSVEINIAFEKKQKLSSVLINCLQNQESWIFLPAQISVFYFDESKQLFKLLGEQLLVTNEKIAAASCEPIIIAAARKVKAQKIKIILKAIKTLPEWHAGKGQAGWILVDEIKLY